MLNVLLYDLKKVIKSIKYIVLLIKIVSKYLFFYVFLYLVDVC